MSTRHFDTAARNAAPAVANPVDIEFTLDEHTLTASPPTSGQLALFVTANRHGGLEAVNSLFQFMATVLYDEDYLILEEKLQEGMDVEIVVEIVKWLVEEWSARPTKSSSAVSESRKTTGRASTANARSKATKVS